MLINQKIYLLLISLESLDLHIIDQMNTLIQTQLKIKTKDQSLDHKYYVNKRYTYSIRDILYSVNVINNMLVDHHIQKTINNILTDYSSFYPNKQHLTSLNTRQYLNRFAYKYQYFYKNKNNKYIFTKHNKIKTIYKIAIVQLYILNKLAIEESPYRLYAYLQSKENNLNAKF